MRKECEVHNITPRTVRAKPKKRNQKKNHSKGESSSPECPNSMGQAFAHHVPKIKMHFACPSGQRLPNRWTKAPAPPLSPLSQPSKGCQSHLTLARWGNASVLEFEILNFSFPLYYFPASFLFLISLCSEEKFVHR